MSKLLLAAFADRAKADDAIKELESAGYEASDISVMSKSGHHVKTETADGSDVGEGAAQGVVTGGAIGGLAGLLAGAGVFPALAGLLIGGPIAVALGLTGVAAATVSGVVTGAVAGGLIGALVSLGVPHDVAESYEKVVDEGGVVVGVPVRENNEEARAILRDNGAEHITETTHAAKADATHETDV